MSDESRLIRKAGRGDRDAFEELVQRHQSRTFWTAYQVVGNQEDARDVAQQVFIRLWQVLPRYRARWAFSTWLYRITVNLAIDAYRRRQARPDTAPPPPEDLSPAPADLGPAGSLEQRELQRVFQHLARLLAPQQRAVFVLKEMNGFDTEEIARILEVAPSTVRNHLHQARKILRRGLASEFPEYLPERHRRQGKR